jgi:hypothetical protein
LTIKFTLDTLENHAIIRLLTGRLQTGNSPALFTHRVSCPAPSIRKPDFAATRFTYCVARQYSIFKELESIWSETRSQLSRRGPFRRV